VAQGLGAAPPTQQLFRRRCCVDRSQVVQGPLPPGEWSDHEGQFGEGVGKSSARWYVGAKIVDTSTEVLDEGMADDDHPGGTVSLQPSHGSKPGFEAPVVGLQRVVGMDLGVMEGLREQLVEHSRVDAVPVGGDLDG